LYRIFRKNFSHPRVFAGQIRLNLQTVKSGVKIHVFHPFNRVVNIPPAAIRGFQHPKTRFRSKSSVSGSFSPFCGKSFPHAPVGKDEKGAFPPTTRYCDGDTGGGSASEKMHESMTGFL